ncbi:MAG: TIM barrel protein, partial [SAR324 cluster bacterium]|nr:TIM barrel protein [SAR324 cluster bacterium]
VQKTFQFGSEVAKTGGMGMDRHVQSVLFGTHPGNRADAFDESVLKICLDTGHTVYAGFDPVDFMQKNMDRISYMHFKDIDPEVKRQTIANRTDFYEACGNGIFCNLGKGVVNFKEVRQLLEDSNFEGWCTVEQDCDPRLQISPMDDARNNRQFLQSIGFV